MKDWIELSIPALRGNESNYLTECVTTNFVSSVGPFIKRFEDSIAASIGLEANKTVATSSGTTALQLGLISIGVKPDDLVILPTYTFIATANAISYVGAKPWIMDVDKKYLTLSPESLQDELQQNTYKKNGSSYHIDTNQRIAGIIPVHVFGYSPDLDKIKTIGENFSIPILLDSACGIGSQYNDKLLGETDLPGIISFNGNKTITTGAGGIFYSNNQQEVDLVKHLSTTAKCSSKYDHDLIGFNYRMSNIQAAVGLAQIEQLNKVVSEKAKIHCLYKSKLDNSLGFSFLDPPPWSKSSNWINAIIINEEHKKKSASLFDKFKSEQIRSNYFWKPLHLQKPYINSLRSKLLWINNIQEKLIPLPSSSTLSVEDQNRVIDAISSVFC